MKNTLSLTRTLWLSLFLIFSFESFAQSGFSTIISPSKVIKHRDNLLFDVPKRSYEYRLSYIYQTSGDAAWERYWGKPKISLNAMHVRFGSEVLGEATAFLPELHFTLKKWKNLRINLQFGTGLAYLNAPYDAIDNPNNNAIGSAWNNTSSLKFGLEYDISPRWSSSLSTGIVHFSNGLSSSPNAGINIYGASFGIAYYLSPRTLNIDIPTLSNSSTSLDTTRRKWIVDMEYHYGLTEQSTPGGPKYAVHAIGVAAGYRYREFLTAFLGAEYEYNDGNYIFFRESFFSEEESKDRAKSTIIYAAHELRFGKVFNRVRLGFYLPYPSERTKTFYIKTVTGLYLPSRWQTQPYIGVLLKTHSAVADYIGVVFGVSI